MFYTFCQNNSGGYTIENDDVAEFVIIEANSDKEAINKIKKITKNYMKYCPCCGERWDFSLEELQESKYIVPSIFGEPITKISRFGYIIYYLNGEIERSVEGEF